MISREKLIEELENPKTFETQCEITIDDIVGIIKEQPQADKWIPCSERLPKKKGYYICTVYRYEDDEHNVFDLWFENGKWYVDEVNDCEEYRRSKIFIHEVIAWQPLPQPYKKEGAE